MESFNTSQSAFSSRRSYPALNHVSLAPLTPRFPIDDDDEDDEPADYFTARGDSSSDHTHGNVYSNAGRTSYLSSVSVPSTPPILSHSRSTSRARQPRSKSQTRLPMSDTNLQSHDLARPLHHHRHNHNHNHRHHHHRHNDQSSSSKHGSQSRPRHARHDSEWLLRAGIALASSTREEKGQSWLVKRESSTSLVNDANLDGTDLSPSSSQHPYHRYTRSSAARTPRSGMSTPSVAAALSRRNSRSHGGSRRGSRAGLAMTSLDITSAAGVDSATVSPSISTSGQGPERGSQGNRDGASTGLVAGPDFVDEHIRAEMASIQAQNHLNLSNNVNDTYYPLSDEESLAGEDALLFYSSDEEEEEIDERELQRLTRQRGFGLGGWLDRLVEWTLFGVDDWPVTATTATTTAAMAEEGEIEAGDDPSGRLRAAVRIDDGLQHRQDSEDEDEDDADHFEAVDPTQDTTLQDAGEGAGRIVEEPGEVGGWEDASWLFRIVKQALI